jgi:uncharacterized membrane protein
MLKAVPHQPHMSHMLKERVIATGRIFYGMGMVALGAQHFVNRAFVAVIVPSLPPWLPGQAYWPYIGGIFLIAAGAAISVGKSARPVAIALGTVLLVPLVFRHIPVHMASDFRSLGAWTNPLKELTLAGGAFVVASSLPGKEDAGANGLFRAFGCFSIALTVGLFGVDHFVYAQWVVPMVPAWIPARVFWTFFAGCALIAAAIGLLLGICARKAAGLLGLMIFAWLLVLHIPRAIADPHSGNGNEWTSVSEALAFSGIAFMLSQTLPKKES